MPLIPLDDSYPPRLRLKVGDVLMIHRKLRDKQTDKPFWWKFLGAVTKVQRVGARVHRFGADDDKAEHVVRFGLHPDEMRVWLIPPEEWPDGVHAFRTRLILEGKLDDALFDA